MKKLTVGDNDQENQMHLRTDEELMKAYQLGDIQSFDTLYSRYHARVYGFLCQKLSTSQLPLLEDAFQLTFMKLHQFRHQYDASFPFAPWIFTVCRSAMLDILRGQKRIHKQEELNQKAVETAIQYIPEDPSDELPDLSKLTPQQRQAVEMRYFEDLSFDEIARQLKTSPSNVRQIVSRTIRSFKKLVKKKGDRL